LGVAGSNCMYALRKAKTDAGFTLMEVMVSLFVMTLIVLMFAATLPMAAKSSKMNGNYAQAMSLCQHKIDQMRSVGYGALTYSGLRTAEIIDASPTSLPYSFQQMDSLSSYFTSATGTINVQSHSTHTNVRIVTVRVQWTGTGARQTAGTCELVALIASD